MTKELNPGAKKRSKEEMARMVAEAFSSKGKGKKEVRTTARRHTHGTRQGTEWAQMTFVVLD